MALEKKLSTKGFPIMKVTLLRVESLERGNSNGLMDHTTREISLMDFSTEKVLMFSKKKKIKLTLDSLLMEKFQAWDICSGLTDQLTMENLLMELKKVKARKLKIMETFTLENSETDSVMELVFISMLQLQQSDTENGKTISVLFGFPTQKKSTSAIHQLKNSNIYHNFIFTFDSEFFNIK